MVDEEMVYIIPLRKAKAASPKKRAPRAIKTIRDYLRRHTKATGRIIIDKSINEKIWERGIANIPHHIRVKVFKGEEIRATIAE